MCVQHWEHRQLHRSIQYVLALSYYSHSRLSDHICVWSIVPESPMLLLLFAGNSIFLTDSKKLKEMNCRAAKTSVLSVIPKRLWKIFLKCYSVVGMLRILRVRERSTLNRTWSSLSYSPPAHQDHRHVCIYSSVWSTGGIHSLPRTQAPAPFSTGHWEVWFDKY